MSEVDCRAVPPGVRKSPHISALKNLPGNVKLHPCADRAPVPQAKRRGPHPLGVAILWKYRSIQPHAAEAMRQLLTQVENPMPRFGVVLDAARQELLDSLPHHEAACLEAARHILATRFTTSAGRSVNTIAAATELALLHFSGLDRERFGVAFVDTQGRLIAFEEMFLGTLSQTAVYPREVARRALALNACSVILAHNHPSGSLHPSSSDIQLTATLRQVLALIEVSVLDHIIVGAGKAVSLAEIGVI